MGNRVVHDIFVPYSLGYKGFFISTGFPVIVWKKETGNEKKLEQIKAEAIRQINESDALDRLNDVRVNFLGKKGELTAVLKSMKDVAPEERPKVGQMVNEAREEIERVMDEAKTEWSAESVKPR